jgi:hypothetical protein
LALYSTVLRTGGPIPIIVTILQMPVSGGSQQSKLKSWAGGLMQLHTRFNGGGLFAPFVCIDRQNLKRILYLNTSDARWMHVFAKRAPPTFQFYT